MLVYRNKGTAAILVYQANPLGIELYFYVNGHVSENALWALFFLREESFTQQVARETIHMSH